MARDEPHSSPTPFVTGSSLSIILSYVEAILRIYNMHGRRDNMHKARIKIIVNQMGIDKYRELVDERVRAHKGQRAQDPAGGDRPDRRVFRSPQYEPLDDISEELGELRRSDAAFDRWMASNVVEHKAPGYSIVNITLKAPGRVPGDISADDMDAVADLADRYSLGEIRVSHRQNLTFVDVQQRDLHTLWQELDARSLATPNLGQLTDIICCPGLDYCNLANARSIPVANDINQHFWMWTVSRSSAI